MNRSALRPRARDARKVTTPPADLSASQVGRTDIFTDLGTGTVWGSHTFSSADSNQVISIPLDAAAIAQIQIDAGLGHSFQLGGTLSSFSGISGQYEFVFGATGWQWQCTIINCNNGP